MSNRINRGVDIRKIENPQALMPWANWYRMGECGVCIAVEDGLWHMSISCPHRDPTWDEIATARYRLIPDKITMAMLLPPMREYVNVHEHVFHLHEIKE